MFCVLWFFFCFFKAGKSCFKKCSLLLNSNTFGGGGGRWLFPEWLTDRSKPYLIGWQPKAISISLADSPRRSPSHWLTVRDNLWFLSAFRVAAVDEWSPLGDGDLPAGPGAVEACWPPRGPCVVTIGHPAGLVSSLSATPRALCRHYRPPRGPCIVTMGHPAGLVSSLSAIPRALCHHYGPPRGPCVVTMGHPAGLVSSLWATPRALCRHYRPPRGPCVVTIGHPAGLVSLVLTWPARAAASVFTFAGVCLWPHQVNVSCLALRSRHLASHTANFD